MREPLLERTIATGAAEELVGLVARGGSFAIGAYAKTPIDQPDKHFDADLFFASGRLDRPAAEIMSRTLSIENDEEPRALVACQGDRSCFAGKTGFVSLDRGRSTEPQAKGFILAVDAQGKQKELAFFEGPRDTEILRATETPGGGITFAFLRNEPAVVGRAPTPQKGNELWLGVFTAP